MNGQELTQVNRTLAVTGTFQPQAMLADADGDQIPDDYDAYPNDATRASKICFPITCSESDLITMAYEDLYPLEGDGDLNDYVTWGRSEEDVNAKGKIVKLRTYYQHVAKGTLLVHTFRLRFGAAATGAGLVRKVTGFTNVVTQTNATFSANDLKNGISVYNENSSQTSQSANNTNSITFKPGKKAALELTFNTPVARAEIGHAPYDPYIVLVNTAPLNLNFTETETHLPGKNSSILQILTSGSYPFSIVVPGIWHWQVETLDIRLSVKTGYLEYAAWVDSGGISFRDWYTKVTKTSAVYNNLPATGTLAGFINVIKNKYFILGVLLVLAVSLGVGFALKKRLSATVA
ncbi:LruC domain-containing protein [Leptospira idonii]|uniref:LruC domain-containing protein n=2 Tax=Leptospira idonii TaxID=1193500 RepID=A0A4V3JYF0_9LEPT|nr:LruC domain-containing protein [Leptospira idonii]